MPPEITANLPFPSPIATRVWGVALLAAFVHLASAACQALADVANAPPNVVLMLTSPLDYQVVQRQSRDKGVIPIAGTLTDVDAKAAVIEARITTGGKAGPWRKLAAKVTDAAFEAGLEAPAGGWHRVEVRVKAGEKTAGEAAIEHVGIGEIFVVAGQSNSANHGAEKQETRTGKVATFDGQRWQLSKDPQPGASGGGGSFLPPFGDAMAKRFEVPVGFVACGIGATSVREWLPAGTKIANPPTLTDHLIQLPGPARGLPGPAPGGAQWVCKGLIYKGFVARLKQMGPRGFRAVLWHQGESDANQKDPTRTLQGKLYREYLEVLIKDTRREIGWDAPWFVAQVSYHVPGDEASPDIRAAQASLWKDRIALEGPDSDALKSEWREAGGKGVHFSGPGLREHAARWVEKVGPWLHEQLAPPKPAEPPPAGGK